MKVCLDIPLSDRSCLRDNSRAHSKGLWLINVHLSLCLVMYPQALKYCGDPTVALFNI